MRMEEFMNVLQTKLATQQPNYPDNAESILEVLFDAYNESSGFDNAAIKADFEDQTFQPPSESRSVNDPQLTDG